MVKIIQGCLIPVNQWLWDHLRLNHGSIGPAFRAPKRDCETCQRLGMVG